MKHMKSFFGGGHQDTRTQGHEDCLVSSSPRLLASSSGLHGFMVILLLCGCFSLSSHLSAQQATFRVRTDLVQVDVVVVDKDGNPVTGLTKEDFVILDRKKPQTIEVFEEFKYNAKEAAMKPGAFPPQLKLDFSSNQSAQSARLILMVIDDLHIYKERTERAKEILRKVVADLGAESSMAVLFTSGEGSIEVTQNPAALLAAVDTLKGRRPYPRPMLPDTQRGGDLQTFNDNIASLKTVKDASRMLIGGPQRRKALVMVTEGFAKELVGFFGPGQVGMDAPDSGSYMAGNLEGFGVPGNIGANIYDYELVDMMDALRRANIAAYSIDPRGKVTTQSMAAECHGPGGSGGLSDPCLGEGGRVPPEWASWVRIAQREIQLTAEASGGFAIVNTDDFTGGIDRIVSDLDQYYVLGFAPSDSKGNSYRPISVQVKNRTDLTLRYRTGYVGNVKEPGAKNEDPLHELAAGAMPATELPLRLGAMPRPVVAGDPNSVVVRGERPKDPKSARVSIALEVSVPRTVVTRTDGTLSDAYKYTVFAVNLKTRKIQAQFTNTAQLSSERMPKEAVGETIAFLIPAELMLPPGSYQLRASVTSTRLEKGGSVYLAIDVPDFTTVPLAVSGLIVGPYGSPRVPVAETPVQLPFVPSVDREFFSTDTLRVYFEIASKRPNATIPVKVEIVAADGKTVKSASPSLEPVDLGKLDIQVPLTGLPAGAYILRVTATDQGKSATRETGFIVK